MLALPAGMFVGGLASHRSYAVGTALLSAEALADTQLPTWGMKAVDGRLHPIEIPRAARRLHPHLVQTQRSWKSIRAVFLSGHTSAAFSVATVFASRYHEHRWVPWVAYGLASVVALSRLPDQAHFPSDLFAGSVVGYTITRYVVLRH